MSVEARIMDVLDELPLGEEEKYELQVRSVEEGPPAPEGFSPITVRTSRGAIDLRLYPSPRARAGVVWLGGGGDWESPARGLYPRLCEALLDQGMSSCRVRFRDATSLPESVLDALVAVRLLTDTGCPRVGLVGFAFGAAVAVQAATNADVVSTVVTLATQTYGASLAADLASGQSALLVHGTADEMLPPSCSRTIHRMVPGRKRLVYFDGARHALDEVADDVTVLVRRWLLAELGGDS